MLVHVQPPHARAAVTISVPHSGRPTAATAHTPRRLGPPGTTGPDGATWEIARDIAADCDVALVRGLLPRAICDYNRPAPTAPVSPQDAADWAFDSPATLPYWLAYHRHIAGSLNAAAKQGLQPLLLDLHGFASRHAPARFCTFDVILGTGNRTTVTGYSDAVLAAYLRGFGYRVFLPRRQPVAPDGDHLSGRFTIRNVAGTLGVNAIQVEISDRFRTAGAQVAGKLLARHLAGFVRAYSS